MGDDEMLGKINEKMDEMYKLKRQLFDQRREYNNILVKEARAEHLSDIVKEAADRLAREDLTERFEDVECGDDEAILCLADWHYGMTTDNIWNKFNIEICKN